MNTDHPVIARLSELEEAAETGYLGLGTDPNWVIFLLDGLIEYISGGDEADRLGRLLVADGTVDQKTIDRLVRKTSNRRLLGEILLANGAARPQQLKTTLKGQILGRFERLLQDQNATLLPFEQISSPRKGLRMQLGVKSLLLELARRQDNQSLRPAQTFSLRNPDASELARWPWKPQEAAVVSHLLHGPAHMTGLAKNMNRSPEVVRHILTALQELGLLEEDKSGLAMDPASANGALGIIPQVQARYSKDILLNDADQPFVREQFRTLKVRLSTLERTGRGRVITISSPFIEEGKSLLSANLAYVCAEDPDRRVLLIDGDLRRSSLHTYLGVDRVPGVTDYLTQEGLEPHCFMRRSGRLYWMSSGFLAPNPIELLSSDNMAELIEYSRKHFDLVIIDCPPLEPVSDTSVLTDLSDGLVLVVRSGKTSYGSAERALRNVDPNRVLGIVLNGVQPMAFNTYHGRHYYYGGKHAYPSVDQDSE